MESTINKIIGLVTEYQNRNIELTTKGLLSLLESMREDEKKMIIRALDESNSLEGRLTQKDIDNYLKHIYG